MQTASPTSTTSPLYWTCLEGCDARTTNLATGTLRVCKWLPRGLRDDEIVRIIQPAGQRIYERWSIVPVAQKSRG
jgi:hypothetical protein